MRPSRFARSLIAVLSFAACSRGDRSVSNASTVADSAGVVIVSNSQAQWTPATQWTLESAPSITIGESGDSIEALSGISSHLRLPDSTIVLVPSPARELRFYDTHGQFLRTAGRSGSGPGEFRSIAGMFACGSDSLVVADYSRRISIWSATGEFIREVAQPVSATGFNPTVVGVSRDCASLLVRDARPLPPDQQSGRHHNQLNWRPLNGSPAESVTTFPGIETAPVMYGGMVLKQAIVFSNQPEFASTTDHIVVGMGDRAEFRTFDVHGTLQRIVRWNQKAQRVTASDREIYSRLRAEYVRKSPEDGRALPTIDLLVVAKTKPLFARILLDDTGNTWLCQCPDRNVLFRQTPPESETVPWLVFDSTGNMLGAVSIPARLNVQRIDHGEVGGVWRNDDDAPSLRIYRIRKPGPEVVR